MKYNMERASRESLEQQVQLLQQQNEDLRRANVSLAESTTRRSSTIIKIDANKPMPAQEHARSSEDESSVYLGKQRKPDTLAPE